VGTRKKLGIFKLGADFACSATTRGGMDKPSSRVDSARQTGLDSILQEVLTVVDSGSGGDNKSWGNFRYWAILGRYFCIWRCQNNVQGPRNQGHIVESSLDRFYVLGMMRFYL
jgi:hypothetical protein